jgi:hypothetical protein
MGVNFLTDRTEDEIKKLPGFVASTEARKEGTLNMTDVARSIYDWRTMGGVTESKIKDIVDHAGLSPPLLLSKVITSPRPEPSSPSPNPTSSIAHG